MVIASIDLKDGRVVQLKNGKSLVLERNDADALIEEFNRYGEVAVIDVDAALGNSDEKGNTKNTELLKRLLRKGNVRVGGGIRSVKRAKELVALGAEKVIVGSAAWNIRAAEQRKSAIPDSATARSASACVINAADGDAVSVSDATASDATAHSAKSDIINAAFLDELVSAIGKQRVIIAVDSIGGNIAVNGWTETVNVPLVQGAQLAEKYCSELLFTCVEKEGCMSGTDMTLVQQLRSAVSCRVVAAGGVSSVPEIAALEKIGCDVQLGMALYTGAVSLKDAFIGCLNWAKSPLIPVIAQSVNGDVLMLGYANQEAFAKSFDTNRLTFFSRTRGTLWTKGETSGNYLELVKLRADCDRDTVLATVVPRGNVCHTGAFTCFSGEAAEPSSAGKLYNIIAERFAHPTPGSYTATLDDTRVREKIMEEAEELCDEAQTKQDVVWETADLFYFLNVLMYKEGVTWKDVYDELDRRHRER
ncbi:MAG: bifunctional phosphoribosyl-AMP cyclohydrolase/phosphoribosyl-ATP diphosphatase HisIE [Treponema sp.]|nr:bifunctional phosphoribosyl-AMP cyclohydrolase/phosphoribosyl-ATP diphosphatase HisIE [Treponema sp.]